MDSMTSTTSTRAVAILPMVYLSEWVASGTRFRVLTMKGSHAVLMYGDNGRGQWNLLGPVYMPERFGTLPIDSESQWQQFVALLLAARPEGVAVT